MTAIDIMVVPQMCTYFTFHIRIAHIDMFWINRINVALFSFFIQIMDFSSILIEKKLFSIKRWFRSTHNDIPLSPVLGAATPVSTV